MLLIYWGWGVSVCGVGCVHGEHWPLRGTDAPGCRHVQRCGCVHPYPRYTERGALVGETHVTQSSCSHGRFEVFEGRVEYVLSARGRTRDAVR